MLQPEVAGRVTPFVGVWIETLGNAKELGVEGVTPFVGVWIETSEYFQPEFDNLVTPFVGVWIETGKHWMTSAKPTSHPSWVCGLKP